MAKLKTENVGPGAVGVQLVSAGDGPTLIGNTDITTVLWLSFSNATGADNPSDSIDLSPQSWVVVDGEEDVFGCTSGPVIAVHLIPGGISYFQSGISGGGFTANKDGTFFYDGVAGPGTLICAITGTGASGTDQYGNQYIPGGMCIVAQTNATSLFSVVDNVTSPGLLASIAGDGSFTTEGTVSASTDLTVGGYSVPNDLLPPMPQGLIARASVLASSLPVPVTPVTGEFFIYELDVTFPVAGRECLLVIEPMSVQLGNAGKIRLNLYATSDGSQVTNASPIIATVDTVAGGVTANFNMRTAPLIHQFSPPVNGVWRFLVSMTTVSTGAGVPTFQLQQLGFNPGTDGYSGSNGRFSVYDMGATVANTGRAILTGGSSGSGGGTQNYVKTYLCTASHCYQGSDGTNSNLKINDGGHCVQGGNVANTYNGHAKSWYEFNQTQIMADLAGATITRFQIYLNNNHTWYNSGMTAAIGYDTKTGFGGTEGDPAGPGIDALNVHYNEGQAKWVDATGLGFGTSFQTVRSQIVLYKNSNNLQYYGYFAGRGQNNPCQIKISYTK